jgi:hypothetical protein
MAAVTIYQFLDAAEQALDQDDTDSRRVIAWLHYRAADGLLHKSHGDLDVGAASNAAAGRTRLRPAVARGVTARGYEVE